PRAECRILSPPAPERHLARTKRCRVSPSFRSAGRRVAAPADALLLFGSPLRRREWGDETGDREARPTRGAYGRWSYRWPEGPRPAARAARSTAGSSGVVTPSLWCVQLAAHSPAPR